MPDPGYLSDPDIQDVSSLSNTDLIPLVQPSAPQITKRFSPGAIATFLANVFQAKSSKLDAIVALTDPIANLRDRSTHTGTQTASTISDFTAAARASFSQGANITITNGTISSTATSGIRASVPVSNNKTLGSTDANTVQVSTGTSNITVTIPPESTFNYSVDTEVDFLREGTGTFTLVSGAGVTLKVDGTLATVTSFVITSATTIRKVGVNDWRLYGNTDTIRVYDQQTEPTSGQKTEGIIWWERNSSNALIGQWVWDATLSLWKSLRHIELNPPGGLQLSATSDRPISLNKVPNTTGVVIERIGASVWTAGTNNSTHFFTFTPGYYPRSAVTTGGSTDWTAFNTQSLAANGTNFTDIGTDINASVAWTNLLYLRLNIVMTGSPGFINYCSYVRARYYR